MPSVILGWLTRHLQVALSSLGALTRAPAASLMTAAVIGIALALPTGLYLLMDNLHSVSADWGKGSRLSVFLKQEVSADAARALRLQVGKLPAVADVTLITPQQALAEYRELSGFAVALDALEQNPLPAVLVVDPAPALSEAGQLQTLVDQLAALDEVEVAQLDLQWVQRLAAILAIVQRGVLVLAVLLAVSVLLIVGNTIRLGIENRREEIEITRLFGGTDAFIRRPFLYTGAWFGLAGGILAWLLVTLSFWLVNGPVSQLATLYYSRFSLQGLDFTDSFLLLTGGALLGLAGSWLAVGRHLRAIQPS